MDAIDPAIDPNTIYEVGTQTVLTDPAKLTVCQKFIMQYGGLLATAIKTPKMNGVMLADNLIAMATATIVGVAFLNLGGDGTATGRTV